jgi:hypothetical protein
MGLMKLLVPGVTPVTDCATVVHRSLVSPSKKLAGRWRAGKGGRAGAAAVSAR